MDGVSKELLIGLSGLLVGALINGLGFLYRTRLDSKKSARRTLYLLLEIRHTLRLSMVDTVGLTQQYRQHCEARLVAKEFAEPLDGLDGLLKSHLDGTLQAMRSDVPARLLLAFEQALAELSSVDPVLAYRLRGKERLGDVVVEIQGYLARISASLAGQSLPAQIGEVDTFVRQSAFAAIGQVLDADIRRVARACGWLDFLKVRGVLKSKIGTTETLDVAELDARLNKLWELLDERPKDSKV